ncbi:unnamed protein product [Agarophyton chilense]
MKSCFTAQGGMLTRTERKAIARLHKHRAAAKVPRAEARPAVCENTDILFSFYCTATTDAHRAHQCARAAKKAADRRVRKVDVSGTTAVKRLS